MNADEKVVTQPAVPEVQPATPQPATGRFPDLAEFDREIRCRLRSNQRFLERFLDEDFVDDETGEDDEPDDAGEEEL